MIPRATLGWLLLAAVLTIGAVYYAGKHNGARDERTRAQAQLVDTMQTMAARAAEQAQVDFALAARNERAQRAVTAIFTSMQREVAEYVASHPAVADCRLDDDGLRLWSAANAGAAPASAPGESDDGVRSAAAAKVGRALGPVEQSRGGDGAAASMPAAP